MDQLKRLRVERGLSQARLAARAELDPSTVNQIERGAREASSVTLRKLADALDVNIAELLGEPRQKAAAPSSPEAHDEEGRRLHYLRTLGLFATSMESRWSAKVQRDVFSEEEFGEGIATLQNLENACLRNSGNLFIALRAHEGSLSNDFPEAKAVELRAYALTLPETELEALLSTKAAIDAWHLTMWRAYDALRARDAADVAQLADYRKHLQAMGGEVLETAESETA